MILKKVVGINIVLMLSGFFLKLPSLACIFPGDTKKLITAFKKDQRKIIEETYKKYKLDYNDVIINYKEKGGNLTPLQHALENEQLDLALFLVNEIKVKVEWGSIAYCFIYDTKKKITGKSYQKYDNLFKKVTKAINIDAPLFVCSIQGKQNALQKYCNNAWHEGFFNPFTLKLFFANNAHIISQHDNKTFNTLFAIFNPGVCCGLSAQKIIASQLMILLNEKVKSLTSQYLLGLLVFKRINNQQSKKIKNIRVPKPLMLVISDMANAENNSDIHQSLTDRKDGKTILEHIKRSYLNLKNDSLLCQVLSPPFWERPFVICAKEFREIMKKYKITNK